MSSPVLAWPGASEGADPVARACKTAAFNAELLAEDSATRLLERIALRLGLRGPVTARRLVAAPDAFAEARARADLQAQPDEAIVHRHVELACGGQVLSRADNWYLPHRLAPEMARQLVETDAPFGRVVAPLAYTRVTLETEVLAQGPDVLRHRAQLVLADERPISLVEELYPALALAAYPPR